MRGCFRNTPLLHNPRPTCLTRRPVKQMQGLPAVRFKCIGSPIDYFDTSVCVDPIHIISLVSRVPGLGLLLKVVNLFLPRKFKDHTGRSNGSMHRCISIHGASLAIEMAVATYKSRPTKPSGFRHRIPSLS
jgi:hypothetical protein